MARACRLARRWSGNTLPNPILDTELPTWDFSTETSVRAPNIFEVRALLNGAEKEGLHLHVYLRVIVATGMRRGEACALRWSDIDWNMCSVLVDESVISSARHAQVKSPKTRASIRCLAIDERTLELVFELQREQLALANFAEVPLDPDGFIFSYTPGGMLPPHPDSMTGIFTRLRTKTGVARDIHLHSLRHFQATALDSIIPGCHPGVWCCSALLMARFQSIQAAALCGEGYSRRVRWLERLGFEFAEFGTSCRSRGRNFESKSCNDERPFIKSPLDGISL